MHDASSFELWTFSHILQAASFLLYNCAEEHVCIHVYGHCSRTRQTDSIKAHRHRQPQQNIPVSCHGACRLHAVQWCGVVQKTGQGRQQRREARWMISQTLSLISMMKALEANIERLMCSTWQVYAVHKRCFPTPSFQDVYFQLARQQQFSDMHSLQGWVD